MTPDPRLPVDPDTPEPLFPDDAPDAGEVPASGLPPPVNAAVVDPLSPEESRREAQSALMAGGSMAGAATGAGIGAAVAGPLGIIVGASVGYAAGALGAAAATAAGQSAAGDAPSDGELARLLRPEAGTDPDRPEDIETLDTSEGAGDAQEDDAAARAAADRTELWRRSSGGPVG